MRLTIVGVGMMGEAAAQIAAAELPLAALHLVDVDRARVTRVARRLARGGLAVTASTDWRDSAADADAALLAMPWPQTEQFLEATRARPLPVVSITRPPVDLQNFVPDYVRVRAGPALLPIGLEPGLAEILLIRALSGLPGAQKAEILCGGLTVTRPSGFPYRILFGGRTLPFASRPAFSLEQGRLRTHRRFDGVRPASVPRLPTLESYFDGMVPWLDQLPAVAGVDVEQRTLRWPGFASAVATLRDAGLLADREVTVDGIRVSVRRFAEAVLGERLQRGADEREVTHLQVTAHGSADGFPRTRRINLWCRDDETPVASGMACLTAVPAVVAASLVVGLPPGWIRPDEVFVGDHLENLRRVLARYGAHYTETDESETSVRRVRA